MSKHWNPRSFEPPRGRAGRWDRRPAPRRRRSRGEARVGWGEIRLMLLGGLFLGFAYAFIPAPQTALAGGGTRVDNVLAVQVIDGDTFRYGGERIRIADIDTPERQGRCPYETQLAARATERMGELLRAGPFEMHRIDRDEDRYGRKLRVVTRGGESLGDRLVAEGLARTWTGRREPWCR